MVSCGLVPAAMEEELGEEFCVLNAGTGSQQVWGSYYYLKDLVAEYEPQYVILGVDQWAFTKQDRGIRRDLVVMDRIKHPQVKLAYVRDIFKPEEYPYLLKSYANRDEFENIGEHLRQKLSKEYFFDQRENVKKSDLSRGHTGFGASMGKNKAGIQRVEEFSQELLDENAVRYLEKIVELCRDEGIRLYIVGLPIVSTAVYATETYPDFYEFFRDFAEENGIVFWDFNLLKDRKEVIPDERMGDTVHVGDAGERQVSRRLGELLKADIAGADVNAEFWESVEAWKESKTGIVGCDFHTEDIPGKKDRLMIAESVQAENVVAEYEFWVSADGEGGKWHRLQEYGTDKECVIPAEYLEADVWLKICSREAGSQVPYEKACIRFRAFGS